MKNHYELYVDQNLRPLRPCCSSHMKFRPSRQQCLAPSVSFHHHCPTYQPARCDCPPVHNTVIYIYIQYIGNGRCQPPRMQIAVLGCRNRWPGLHSPLECFGLSQGLACLLPCLCLCQQVVLACGIITLDKPSSITAHMIHNGTAQVSLDCLGLGASVHHFHFTDNLTVSLISEVVERNEGFKILVTNDCWDFSTAPDQQKQH